jgi:endonuclease-3
MSWVLVVPQVNEVTPELFALAPDAAAMASQEVARVQKIIQPIGLAPTKAKNLVNMSKVGGCCCQHIET